MSRPNQELRPSQFITTYGPGSILETRSGPVVIKSMDEIFRRRNRDPQDFAIRETRLARAELDGARIVRVPTNAELEAPGDEDVYPTEAFPFWALCTRHSPEQILYRADAGCPRCGSMQPYERREKAGREAIRFVLACPEGHLDDVNWSLVVHQGSGRTCKPDHYVWHGGGRSLRHVELECPKCKIRVNFGTAYSRPWPCSGRYPELGSRYATKCTSRDARIFQRGASNLRIPVVQSALTILDLPAALYNVLKNDRIITTAKILRRRGWLDQGNFMQEIDELEIPSVTKEMLRGTPWRELEQGLQQLFDEEDGVDRSLRDEEFDRLVRAATHGAPAVQSDRRWGPPLFEVIAGDVKHFMGPAGNYRFRVTPVSRLHMIMVQTGYQRVDFQAGDQVSCAFKWQGQQWYPGIELFGEGVFIDLDGVPLTLSGPRASAWTQKHANDPDSRYPVYPDSVWWHTLSHRILQALSVDSGYSSAAIRERTYVTFDSTGTAHGGVLLYTVQPGGDGTLGGLIALVSRFDQILSAALRDVRTCSNDPLCEEAPSHGTAGAACYSCLLASETSCEHRNLGLDRLLLVENLP